VDLERYRKDAKALVRAYRRGDDDALARAGAVLGDRAAARFQLSDAQHVVAVEHGYRSWPALKEAAESAPRERPVGRIGLQPVSFYEERAAELDAGVAEGDEEALRRAAIVPNGDPHVVVAREYAFETWRELVATVERVRATQEGQREGSPEVLAALDAMERGDVEALRAQLDASPSLAGRVHTGAWATLLEALAQPDVVPFDRDIAALLVERTDDLVGPLGLAACFDRSELVRLLLESGADAVPDPDRGLTPLEAALYHGSRRSAELIAERGISPLELWSAAGLGRIDLMQRLLDEPPRHRPNLADVGWQPGPPPADDRQTILDEALCFAALNGRVDACEWLLERGAAVNGAPYLGMTPLHFAACFDRPNVVKLLRNHGADTTLRDRIHGGTPAGWAHHAGRTGLAALLEGWETELEYVPGEPVRLRVDVRRFYEVDDEGRAVELAGRPAGWREPAARIEVERVVNVTRDGVVTLPVMGGNTFEEIAERIARASLELYGELLELG
jgi:ankyrin repeat protein